MFCFCSHLLQNQLLLCNVVSNLFSIIPPFPWTVLVHFFHPVFKTPLVLRILLTTQLLTADLPRMESHLVTCQRLSRPESPLFRTKRTEVTDVLVDICVSLSIELGWELLLTLGALENSRRHPVNQFIDSCIPARFIKLASDRKF